MRNREWESMNEEEFEAMLERSVSDFPPEDVVAEVTPWKKAMRRVLTGMVLCAVTLDFWCLNYLLPAIGMVLSLLGFRTLQRENKWFRSCFFISVIRAACFFPVLVLHTTIIQNALLSTLSTVLTLLSLILLFGQFFCVWRGLRDVQKKVHLPPRAGSAVALMVWYALICVLAAIQYQGLLIAGAMIIGYLFLIRNLYKLSKELDEAGYSIRTVSLHVTDQCIVLVLVSALAIGCACGYSFGGRYPMNWAAVDSSEQTENEEIRNHLIELGFPEYVLNDLTAEDIASCAGASEIVVDITDKSLLEGSTTTEMYRSDGECNVEPTSDSSAKDLRLTGVGVQIPGEQERWIIFHHFLWTANPGCYGTESIQLWPVYQNSSDGWGAAGEVTGQVLYDRDGKTYASAYHSLGNQTFTFNSILWGEQTRNDVFATFSMPAQGEHYRGYIAYPVVEIQDGYSISSWVNYTHQKSRIPYPAVTAMEHQMTGNWNENGAFITIQDDFQFYTTENDIEIIH